MTGRSGALPVPGGPVPKLDTGLLDSPTGTLFIDAADHLNRLRTLFCTVKKSALDPSESRDFVHRMTKEL
ncbi:Scr1 family TA system antitoxin-like transcriptional regulator [Streptomyces sp. bgisy022]|uniref:Scr1 family TA system antitoxin-like transcriptional regulator n=1 Tax=Streptomyces sp. bgisy022 TaxID=3413769 RepID=UPI003D72A3B3